MSPFLVQLSFLDDLRVTFEPSLKAYGILFDTFAHALFPSCFHRIDLFSFPVSVGIPPREYCRSIHWARLTNPPKKSPSKKSSSRGGGGPRRHQTASDVQDDEKGQNQKWKFEYRHAGMDTSHSGQRIPLDRRR